MECMAIDPEDHEGAWKKRVGQLKVPDIGEFASSHCARCAGATARRTGGGLARAAGFALEGLEDDGINAW